MTEISEEEKFLKAKIEAPSERKMTKSEAVLDFLKFGVLAAAIVIPIRMFIAQPFVVSGASMVPTFENGHYLIIDELSYRFHPPERGDVIVFRFPLETSKFIIKRLAALPGETIMIKGDEVVITNKEHPSGFIWDQGLFTEGKGRGDQIVALGDDEYFVLGDNRGESADSRLWGPLKREFIVGRPLIRLLPLSKVGILPGEWK